MRTYYHGSEAAEQILADGFRLDGPRRTDAGDFGSGIYLTPDCTLARLHGEVLEVGVDAGGLAFLANPYFLEDGRAVRPRTGTEKLFHSLAFRGPDMLTCGGNVVRAERDRAARAIRLAFLDAGFTGIRTGHRGETVIFDLAAVVTLKRSQK